MDSTIHSGVSSCRSNRISTLLPYGWILGVRRPEFSTRTLGTALLVIVCILLGGWGAPQSGNGSAGPTIEFTTVPTAGAGDPEKLSIIKGRVIGAQPGQQIVIYAKGETAWWVQPFANQPFTKIQPDAKWSNYTHPGTEYAALLVGTDFQPPLTSNELPNAGVLTFAVTHGEPAFWQRWWFPFACVIAGVFVIFGFHRLRLHQATRKLSIRFEERLGERMRVAQELHDTLLQGVLSASMQLHVAVDQMPADSPAQPALNRVLQLMGQVIEEGRNTVRGLRSSLGGAHDLELSFSRIPQELSVQEEIGFRVIVEGPALPLQSAIRNDVYNIGREAVVNAFRHSRARNVEVELEYGVSQLRVIVRDNGCGIDSRVLHSGRDGHWGLSGMRERAERIGGKLKVSSSATGGTEVDLRVPSHIAFESHHSNRGSNWFVRLRAPGKAASDSAREKRTG
jgi:signal transduction histidine kinase